MAWWGSGSHSLAALFDLMTRLRMVQENTSMLLTMNSTSSTTEGVTEGEALQSLSGAVKMVIVALGVIMNLFGVVGNVSILYVIARDKTLRKPYNALLGSMAVNDILRCGVLNMIQVAGIYLEEFPLTWPSQHMMCIIHAILLTQLIIMVPLHIMVIAIHRYLLVCHQNLSDRITNKRTIGILICALHIVSFVLLSGRFNPDNSYRFISSYGRCIGNLPGHLNLTIVSTITFLVIVISLASYISVYHKVSSSKKRLQLFSIGGAIYGNQRRRLQVMTQHQKILLCMVVIVVLLIVSLCLGAFSAWMANKESVSPSTISITMVIALFVGAINSLVYGVLDYRFRDGFKRLFLCKSITTHR